jgi:transcriptional regulator with XRE-family HTH domain
VFPLDCILSMHTVCIPVKRKMARKEKKVPGESVGQKIRKMRLAMNLTVAEMAAQMGFTHNAIQKVESGERQPGPRFIEALKRVHPKPAPTSIDEVVDRALSSISGRGDVEEESPAELPAPRREDAPSLHAALDYILQNGSSEDKIGIKANLQAFAALIRSRQI